MFTGDPWGSSFHGNIYWGGSFGTSFVYPSCSGSGTNNFDLTQFKNADPLLSKNTWGYYSPVAGSPAIHAALNGPPSLPMFDIPNVDDDPHVLLDITGRTRPTNIAKDVGCSQLDATGIVINTPLSIYTAGTSYIPFGSPTVFPTSAPTIPPFAPSIKPTTQPSKEPTSTFAPSIKSTTQPSKEPTSTFAPSIKPTIQPSKVPLSTFAPSIKPTIQPSKVPLSTFVPSIQPTSKTLSTLAPIITPQPTRKPTNSPSMTPFKQPTLSPSRKPTAIPTSKSTSISTRPPTKPTVHPTSHPTRGCSSTNPTGYCANSQQKCCANANGVIQCRYLVNCV